MANDSAPQFGERADYGPNDVCYRHPRNQSFTLCQRCSRTICPQCQVASSVGVLCPECVREMQPSGSQRVTRSATVTARRLAALDTPVTYGIMALNAVVFVLQLIGQYFFEDGVTRALWYAPLYSLPGEFTGGDLTFEPWRMLTSTFTHSTGFIAHILFNMYALWLFGRNLEQLLGRAQFLLLYLFSGLGGSLGVMLWVYADASTINIPTVGASGAIFGVLGATLVAMKAAGANVRALGVMIAINLAIGFMPGVSISWQAHLGGMIVGALTMWVLVSQRGPRKRARRTTGLVAIGSALVLLSFAYFVVLPL